MPSYCGALTQAFPCQLPLCRSHSRRIKALQQDLDHDVPPPTLDLLCRNQPLPVASQPAPGDKSSQKTNFQLSACLRKVKLATKTCISARCLPGLLSRRFDGVTKTSLSSIHDAMNHPPPQPSLIGDDGFLAAFPSSKHSHASVVAHHWAKAHFHIHHCDRAKFNLY